MCACCRRLVPDTVGRRRVGTRPRSLGFQLLYRSSGECPLHYLEFEEEAPHVAACRPVRPLLTASVLHRLTRFSIAGRTACPFPEAASPSFSMVSGMASKVLRGPETRPATFASAVTCARSGSDPTIPGGSSRLRHPENPLKRGIQVYELCGVARPPRALVVPPTSGGGQFARSSWLAGTAVGGGAGGTGRSRGLGAAHGSTVRPQPVYPPASAGVPDAVTDHTQINEFVVSRVDWRSDRH